MHLDEVQRRQTMPNVAALVRNGGVMIMSLRHGPVPPGRRMFDVSTEETIALAQPLGLRCALNQAAEPSLRQPGVSGHAWHSERSRRSRARLPDAASLNLRSRAGISSSTAPGSGFLAPARSTRCCADQGTWRLPG